MSDNSHHTGSDTSTGIPTSLESTIINVLSCKLKRSRYIRPIGCSEQIIGQVGHLNTGSDSNASVCSDDVDEINSLISMCTINEHSFLILSRFLF